MPCTQGALAVDWSTHLDVDATFVVDAVGSTPGVTHSQFAALRVKDAIVDQFRDKCGKRPNVDTEHPALRVNLLLRRGQAILSIDLSGAPLHQRGYRLGQGLAPLKENLAAGMLLRAGWPAVYTSWWRDRRSDVRLGHLADRSGADGRRYRARPAPRLFRLPRLARSRCGIVENAARRGAGARNDGCTGAAAGVFRLRSRRERTQRGRAQCAARADVWLHASRQAIARTPASPARTRVARPGDLQSALRRAHGRGQWRGGFVSSARIQT